MKRFKVDNVTFDAVQGEDKEIMGVFKIDGETVESGFYRTQNAEDAFKRALMNHFSVRVAEYLYERVVA